MSISKGQTISVKVIDLVNVSGVPNKSTYAPPVEGVEIFPASPSLCFLLEHNSGRRLLFDLGVAFDSSKLGEKLQEDLAKFGWKVEVKEDLAIFLDKNGVPPDSIEGIILRYYLIKDRKLFCVEF